MTRLCGGATFAAAWNLVMYLRQPLFAAPRTVRLLKLAIVLVAVGLASAGTLRSEDLTLSVTQLTHGPKHHFFGYIGQCLTTPWNASGRYIVALETSFHDRMPAPGEAATVVLVDAENDYEVTPIETCRAWNFQQGTMFYWHPREAERQFFFNDRDPETNRVFTVLYDIDRRERVREYRFDDPPVANGGVAPTGEFFLAINYGRLARCRPVTGYPGAADPTAAVPAPEDDGIFRIDVESGERAPVVSYRQLRDLLSDSGFDVDGVDFYINHTLCNRSGEFVYFFVRGRRGSEPMAINVPCTVRTDGSELTIHEYIGGHPEWDEEDVVIGAKDLAQVRYDVLAKKIVGQIATPEIIPDPGGDVSLSPDANWFVCGYSSNRQHNEYVIVRRSDGAHVRSPAFFRGPYTSGELRIDPSPRWNRDQTALLVPGVADDGTRQLYRIDVMDGIAKDD